MCFCIVKKKINSGIILIISVVSVKFYCFVYWLKKKNVVSGIVFSLGFCRIRDGSKKLF